MLYYNSDYWYIQNLFGGDEYLRVTVSSLAAITQQDGMLWSARTGEKVTVTIIEVGGSY